MFKSFTKTTVLAFVVFVQLALFSTAAGAQIQPTPELNANQLSFDYMSSDGQIWYDCDVAKDLEPHDFIVMCDGTRFRVHLLLRTYLPLPNQPVGESTYELHYWADRFSDNPNDYVDSSTQSTWITLESGTQVKKIVSYVGFNDDTFQLRVEIKF
jgi:hypothetical protein